MSQSKLFLKLIESLEEKELYELAKLYLQEVDGYQNVIVTNSSYDSGIDLKTLEKYDVQYQATIQAKQIETKIKDDVAKAAKNVAERDLPNKVKYFYSHPISEGAVMDYKKLAKDKNGIFLEIIDAKVLAQIAENYDEISSFLYETAKLKVPAQQSKFFDDDKTKALYDLMSFGKSTDIKHNILKCFVLNFLFKKDTMVSRETLLAELEVHFNTKIDINYFNRFLNKLSTEKKLKITGQNIYLTDEEKSRIGSVLEAYRMEEALLIKDLTAILEKYEIESNIDEIIVKLGDIYECNYTSNLDEFIWRESPVLTIAGATQQLRSVLSLNKLADFDADEAIKELLLATDNNEILSRISAGQAYSKVSDPDRLQQYILRNINNKDIFLDTNVMVYLILVHYQDVDSYKDYNYQVARELLRFRDKSALRFKTIRKYAIEVTDMFKNALSIVPFSKLPVFVSLGGSGNIFYKFFSHLQDNHLLEDETQTFGSFLAEFKFEENKEDIYLKSSIEYLLNSLGIEIVELDEYVLGTTIDIITEDLKANHKNKSHNSIVNDALMFQRLADKNSEINPIEPIFCTWDISLNGARKTFFEDFPNSTKWFMFTPSRLMDHYAMMNFQIRPGTVSNEVLSILSEDHKQMTQQLLISMSVIINPDNKVGLKHTNKINELRVKETFEVDAKLEIINEYMNESRPIDLIITTMVKHYLTNSGKLDTLKSLFTKDDYFETIGNFFLTHTDYINRNGRLKNSLIEEMDSIIDTAK